MTDSRQIGYDVGHGWAVTTQRHRFAVRDQDRQVVDTAIGEVVATGHIPDALRDLMMRRAGGNAALAGLDDEAHDLFWQGFVAGVRGWQDEQAVAAERGQSPN